jgi:hypothetical protein
MLNEIDCDDGIDVYDERKKERKRDKKKKQVFLTCVKKRAGPFDSKQGSSP